ncbi:DUF2306 domain-containing protein [Simiduia sp. 21SJ11W-1]|uniref:DUF2306 domain-containing protein n=1 Tax=Simiduia sp. 21SJ11W-1 TaxID=2909669 RepID=UPI0020A04A6F|nr:DUF2306 domain-containing protein [Simiduia sp. 21SJ11W-1]UTA46800.1 DUF2306 domain-containing protein [Simiduia sp. 21SJ11W-1]
MTDITLQSPAQPRLQIDRLLPMAVTGWFSLAALGHFIFCAYILMVFFPPVAEHGMEGLKGMHLPSGFKEGDFLGNLAAISHVLLAFIIIGGGPVQLMPAVRRNFPRFHRTLGRAYLLAAVLSALAGLYMTWTRSPIGDALSKIGISGDAILILVCAYMTVKHAMARRLAEHRRWAMRLFLVASAVWFFRVGLMGWIMLTGGAGIDFESFTGPFLYFLGFAQYLLPLAMLEWYFYCQRGVHARVKTAFVATLSVLTVYMAVGIVVATAGMWLPRMV